MIEGQNIEIFCGTGGVGKTTLATSRAAWLCSLGKKVLLITIDPARRLKDVLGIDDNSMGKVVQVELNRFVINGQGNKFFDALLLSPEATFGRILSESGESFKNPILKVLSRPSAGMNEIFAVLEVEHYLNKNYDTIVLDTPPGKHFIDFLNSIQKINNFFDKSFVDVFKFLGRNLDSSSESSPSLIKKIVSSGIKKLLEYLERVTGATFIDTFIEAVQTLYKCKTSFLRALKLGEQLENSENINWFLVTSVEHNKLHEMKDFANSFEQRKENNFWLLVNKCQAKELRKWQAHSNTLKMFKNSTIKREEEIKNEARGIFKNLKEFPEVVNLLPREHVEKLCEEWKKDE